MEALEQLYRDELADLYDAEQQILKALPKLIDAASSRELKSALQQHRTATEGQVKRLEQIFGEEGRPSQKKCKGMAGLIAEGEDLLREDYEADVQDAGIIGAAQRVEHYEIAAYGTARAFAERLGRDEAVELLQETLDEEKEADEKLTEIAEASTNVRASREEEGERHARKSRPKRTTNAGRSRRSSRSRSSTHR